MEINNQDISQPIMSAELNQSIPKIEQKKLEIMIVLLVIFVVILGLQAIQIRSLTQALKSGAIAPLQANQGASSLFGGLKSQVGGCGG